MKITVNGVVQEITSTHLNTVLDELGHGGAKVATAVNEVFVPTGLRAQTILSDGDRLEVLAPQQGG